MPENNNININDLNSSFKELNNLFFPKQKLFLEIENGSLNDLKLKEIDDKNACLLQNQFSVFQKEIFDLKTKFITLQKQVINKFIDYRATCIEQKKKEEIVITHNYESLKSDIQNQINELNIFIEKINSWIDAIKFNLQISVERENAKEARIFFCVSLFFTIIISVGLGFYYYLKTKKDIEISQKLLEKEIKDSTNKLGLEIDSLNKTQYEILMLSKKEKKNTNPDKK